MTRTLKIVGAVTCVGLAGWGFFLARQGLDRADKWSSVIGLFVSIVVGLIGIALGWLGLQHERSHSAPSRSPGGSQSVDRSFIGRDNIQIGDARDVDIRRND